MKKLSLIIPVIFWLYACSESKNKNASKNKQNENTGKVTAWKNNPYQVIFLCVKKYTRSMSTYWECGSAICIAIGHPNTA